MRPQEKINIPHYPALERAAQQRLLQGGAENMHYTIPNSSENPVCSLSSLPGPSRVKKEISQGEVIRPTAVSPEQGTWPLHLFKRSPDPMAVSNSECRASLWGQLLAHLHCQCSNALGHTTSYLWYPLPIFNHSSLLDCRY